MCKRRIDKYSYYIKEVLKLQMLKLGKYSIEEEHRLGMSASKCPLVVRDEMSSEFVKRLL